MAKQSQQEEFAKVTIRLPKPLVIAGKHKAIDEACGFQDIVARALAQYASAYVRSSRGVK